MDPDKNAPPLNPLPPIVWVLSLPLIAMEVVFQLQAAGLAGPAQGSNWRTEAFFRFALSPQLLHQQWETGGHPYVELHRLISYTLVHGSFTHAIFAIVMLLALGKWVGEVFRWWAVLVVVLGSTAVGAICYGLLIPGLTAPLIGAYPAVYGLIGAFTFMIFTNLSRVGANKWRAFSLIGALLLVQFVFGVMFGGGWEWVADVTGFAAGFLLSFVVSPGGFQQVIDQLRQR
ncbi:MAG: rhomboid family intramembrane serine protease [Tabrizicola sp.]